MEQVRLIIRNVVQVSQARDRIWELQRAVMDMTTIKMDSKFRVIFKLATTFWLLKASEGSAKEISRQKVMKTSLEFRQA